MLDATVGDAGGASETRDNQTTNKPVHLSTVHKFAGSSVTGDSAVGQLLGY